MNAEQITNALKAMEMRLDELEERLHTLEGVLMRLERLVADLVGWED